VTSGRGDPATEPVAIAVYRVLLRAYPSDFRRRAADELVQVFRDEYDEVRGVGGGHWCCSGSGPAATWPARYRWQRPSR